MLVNGRVTLRCGKFLQQELESMLVQHGGLTVMDNVESSAQEDFLEVVIVRTLTCWCDLETSAHAQRLAGLAEAVGASMHLEKHELRLLRLSALLHDIGKVAIPEGILQKKGPLDREELSVMRLHPEFGSVILRYVGGLFEEIARLVVAHHEAWDGGGYPHGLAGDEIPLLARILAVVDSYDAMTSYRVYTKTLTSLQACQELLRCAGSRYDPLVVDAFLHVSVCLPYALERQRSGMLFHLPWRKAYLMTVHTLDDAMPFNAVSETA